jgi:hypothetical protein
VLIAAAIDNDWLLPGRRNGSALGQLEQVLVTHNPCDPVLRWYPFVYGKRGPDALGYTGPACPKGLGPSRRKIELLNVACSVGKNHAYVNYLGSAALSARFGWYSFLEESQSARSDAAP